ncbi:MAG TPA: hypothetical protein VF843_13235, partial [Streptosporangiaceae bacterium]
MSTAVPLVTVQAPAMTRRGRAAGLLRGTGFAGMLSAAVIALATLVAVIGGAIAPFNPNAPNLALSFVGPTGAHL